MLTLSLVTPALADDGGRMLFDFAKPDAAQAWQPINDGVMGGVSDGRFQITERGTMEFFGTLSLENNGGFASVRSRRSDLGLKPDDILHIRLKGDGREYLLNLYVPTLKIASSYRAAIPTKAGEWTEVKIPLKGCYATSFGEKVPDAGPVDAAKINSIGFMLSDKKAGPFKLEVAWVKVVGGSALGEIRTHDQDVRLQDDPGRHPGDGRPFPARLEGHGQAPRRRVLLRRRLGERQHQAVRDPGGSSGEPGHGRRPSRLPGEVPAGRDPGQVRGGRQERRPLAACQRRQAGHRPRPDRGRGWLGRRAYRRLHGPDGRAGSGGGGSVDLVEAECPGPVQPGAAVRRRAKTDGSHRQRRGAGQALSPTLHVTKDTPPTLVLFGTADRLKPQGDEFVRRAGEAGFRAEVFTAEGQPHGFFNRPPWLRRTTARMDEFLTSLGYLESEGDVKAEEP